MKSSSLIDNNKWNLITIDTAKGLEFKSVIVLSGRMTNNEKYIAYTRALDELFVYDYEVEVGQYIENYTKKIEEKLNVNKDRKTSATNKKSNKKKKNQSIIEVNSVVKAFFEEKGLEVYDNRKNNGHLWVIGEKTLIEKFINEAVDKFGITGIYTSGKEIKYKSGWCTKTRK